MKILAHLMSFSFAFTIIFIGSWAFLGLVIATISFVAWSFPIVPIFSWGLFRLMCALATIFSLLWLVSSENKQWVEETVKDWKGEK